MRCSWPVWGQLVSGWTPSQACPEPSRKVHVKRISAAVCGRRNFGLAIAIALVFFALTSAAHAQNRTASGPPPAKSAKPAEDTQLYHNTIYGFRYQIPYGWVDRTQELNASDAHTDPSSDAATKDKGKEPDASKAEVLLAAFARPPEATGDTINSAIVIASESVASYPGLKRAEDYLGPLTELATSKGFKADGDPYPLEVESRQLLRADFIKPLGAATTGSTTTKNQLTMRQCTLVLLTKGRIVSFTFIAGSEDELDDLMDGLHFDAVKPSTH